MIWNVCRVDEQVLGQMPALAESTPEDDSKADASNSASLYKVTPPAVEYQTTIHISHLFNYSETDGE